MQYPLVGASAALALVFPVVAQEHGQHGEHGHHDHQAKLEAAFTERMSGCRMVGRFTVDGRKNPPQEEAYTISKVAKVGDHRWRFDAKIEYGTKSVTLPVRVDVRWAGDTPMIQVTDVAFPMLGTYSARVLIRGDRYAGTWSGKDYGGHMFGTIEPLPAQGGQVRDANAGGGGDRWPSWRGPENTGVARTGNPPVRWSEDENILWKISPPGLGISSPVVWGDRLYITTAIETDVDGPDAGKAQEDPEPAERGRGRGRGRGRFGGFSRARPTKVHQFAVIAYDRHTGKEQWRSIVSEAVPHEAGHSTASQASNSPVTDGEHIYAHFGSRGIHCLDMDGEQKWSVDLGKMRTRNSFGEGSSPTLHGDLVVVNWDHEGDSFIVALDKISGKERWRTPRDEITSWGTPLVVDVGGEPQVIITGTKASRGYDLATGKELWELSGMTTNCIPTPMYRDGVVYLMSGFRGACLQAVRLQGAKGQLEDTEHVLWEHTRGTSYTPSGLLYDDHLYFLRSNNGVLSCVDAKTGKPHFEGERLEGVRTVYSSPIGVADRVYITSRKGVTIVLKRGDTFEQLAKNELDDEVDASPAVIGDVIYLRGRKSLYCIGAK